MTAPTTPSIFTPVEGKSYISAPAFKYQQALSPNVSHALRLMREAHPGLTDSSTGSASYSTFSSYSGDIPLTPATTGSPTALVAPEAMTSVAASEGHVALSTPEAPGPPATSFIPMTPRGLPEAPGPPATSSTPTTPPGGGVRRFETTHPLSQRSHGASSTHPNHQNHSSRSRQKLRNLVSEGVPVFCVFDALGG